MNIKFETYVKNVNFKMDLLEFAVVFLNSKFKSSNSNL